VHEAVGAVGAALLAAGHIVAAQAHLWLHALIAPSEDSRAHELLVALNRYSRLPLLLRDQLRLRPWPADAPWKEEADQAAALASHGKWRSAVQIVDRLGQQYGADPALVYNRALLGGWLGEERSLVAGLHGFAQLDVPLEDAVEAEAIAQLLDADLKETPVHSVLREYEVRDLDALVGRLGGDRRVEPFELDQHTFPEQGQPPPRHTYLLLDRPLPASGVGITREEVPRIVGVMAVFGRQTDRAERLELTTDKGPGFETAISAVDEIAGSTLGALREERVVGGTSPTDQLLNWRWQFPIDTPPDVRRRLAAEERHVAILERWPAAPRPELSGKSPRQAAADPALRIPLLAAVLILEQGTEATGDQATIAELRRELGLPALDAIDPAGKQADGLPLVRLPRLMLDDVADEVLVTLYRRAVLSGADAAMIHVATEVLRRPSLAKQIPRRDAYQRIIAAEQDSSRALALINEAREQSAAAGESTALWDLAELEEYILRGDSAEASAALARISQLHADDPGFATALYRMLRRLGAIRDDELPDEEVVEEVDFVVPAGASREAAAGPIWTPDSDRPSGGKSTLWTPS
jgi:hypothetical protein